MKLSEVFSQLAYGELSQLSLGTLTDDELSEDTHAPLLAHVNLGLTAIYKRFNLKEGRLVFPLSQSGNVYKLGVADLNKIERVYTAEGTELPLNDANSPLSCYTPQLNILRVNKKIVNKDQDLPEKYRTDGLEVVYRANHAKIVAKGGVIIPEKVELELPDSHLEALLYFVASRAHNPIGMVNEFNAGNNWAAKYEMECQRLELLNLEVDESNENNRLNKNGWV